MFPVTNSARRGTETEAWQARQNKLNRRKHVTGYREKRGKSITAELGISGIP